MNPERLSSTPAIDVQPAPYPMGIAAHPAENGINVAGLTPAQEAAACYAAGQLVVDFVLATTEVELRLGDRPFSELWIEGELARISSETTQQAHTSEEHTLGVIQGRSRDPARVEAADATLSDGSGIAPEFRPEYYKNEKAIVELEKLGKSRTPAQNNNLKALQRRQTLIRRQNSEESIFRGVRGFSRRRKDIAARKGAALRGKSVEDTEALLEGKGRHRPILQMLPSDEFVERRTGEITQTRNIVGRKGFVFRDPSDGRRYVVDDVRSTPAQAFKITGRDPSGSPIYEVDSTGEPTLNTMYHPVLDPTTKKPIIDRRTGRMTPDINRPIPRDDRYRTGKDKVTGGAAPEGPFCYDDGSVIPTDGWGPESFSPIDDIVVLKPLLSGAEAVEALVHGELSGIELDDIHVVIGALCEKIEANPDIIESREAREEILKTHVVYRESEDAHSPSPTPAGLRPKFDEEQGTGHFERFNYTDPRSSRQHYIMEYLTQTRGGRGKAAARIIESRKKELKLRSSKFL